MIDLLLITHDHSNHTKALKEILKHYHVKRLVHNARDNARSTNDLEAAISETDRYCFTGKPIFQSDVLQNFDRDGMTDNVIDPFDCDDCDPEIHILVGGLTEKPNGYTDQEYNNQSLVIRVDFGRSSFLFTGDLQGDGIDDLLDTTSRRNLNVDIYQVGHHGSHNGTDKYLLRDVTPEIAIIGVGSLDDGRDSRSAFGYGHPNIDVIKRLSEYIRRYRSRIDVQVFDGGENPVPFSLRKRIYSTGWDEKIKIRATLNGRFWVTRHN